MTYESNLRLATKKWSLRSWAIIEIMIPMQINVVKTKICQKIANRGRAVIVARQAIKPPSGTTINYSFNFCRMMALDYPELEILYLMSLTNTMGVTDGSRGGGGNPAMPPKAQEGGIMSFSPSSKLPNTFFESEFGSIPKIVG